MVDPGRVDALVARTAEYRYRLLELAGREDQVRSDPGLLGGVKYYFVVAIEACIDPAHHLIASEGFRHPEDFADAFRSLEEAGVIDAPMSQDLQRMCGFRNLLVHGYADIDDERVLHHLRDRLDDFDRFPTAVATFVTGQHP